MLGFNSESRHTTFHSAILEEKCPNVHKDLHPVQLQSQEKDTTQHSVFRFLFL